MAFNNKRMIEIILGQCGEVEERCDGYAREIRDVIVDILDYEQQHRIGHINIQQKIDEKFNATGRFLVEHRDDT